MKRSIYLSLVPLEKARQVILSSLDNLELPESVAIPTVESAGRITVDAVYAQRSIPHYAAAAMDGIAIQAQATFGATKTSPKRLEVGKTAFWINTGAPLPKGTNAVIMIEDVQEKGPDFLEIYQAAHPWQHVRPVGEDTVKGDLLLLPREEIQPPHIALLLNAGVFSLRVRPRPRVAILPTGSELVAPEVTPEPGQIIESNSMMMAAYIREDGGIPTIFPVCEDKEEKLTDVIRDALETSDILLVLSGSSAGSKDFTYTVLENLGQVLIHGIAMMPGKPALFANLSGKPVFGIPGYPTSAVLFYEEVVRPFLQTVTWRSPKPPATLTAHVFRKIPSKLGQEEFIRVRMGEIGGKWLAVPLARGAGILKNLCEADGILRIPRDSEGVNETDPVTIHLRREIAPLRGQLIFIGSHDLSLDRINALLAQEGTGISLAIGAVGSLGGLFALRSGKTHLTAVHLLDPETQSYNIPYLKRYLPDRKIHLIHLLDRTQGLMVRKGNPKGITSIQDLSRKDIQFVNRQRGAGTRVLLDVLLEQEGIDLNQVTGYTHEVATHTMVAAEIRGGMADCGMGIQAAAQALDLDFIPLTREPYDLVIPEEFFEDRRVQGLLRIIRSKTFRKMLRALGGYDPSESGKEKPL